MKRRNKTEEAKRAKHSSKCNIYYKLILQYAICHENIFSYNNN